MVENYFSRSYVQIMVSPIPIRGESTAQCLGLMGRKCLSPWPCLTPNYEIYRRWDLKDLFIKVRKERKKIGTIQSELAQQVYDFFDFSDDWLYEDYWK